ncbi:MAG: FmdB family zinc ribbon protein [Armatimonadota bacterium]
MPIYEYRCRACERRFELLRTFSSKDETAACPACGSLETRRELSVIAAPVSGDGACGWSESAAACLRPG